MPYDVVICGGGLAGLTLGLSLRRRLPDASIVIVERARRPLPVACHKVGESSVEIGARYYGRLLELHDHLSTAHLMKNGLRFFSGHPAAPVVERTEMGPREFPTVAAYQIDRGVFENELRARVEAAGIELLEGWGVRDVTLGSPHRVEIVQPRSDDAPRVLEGRWVVDATGRRRLIAKKLGLHRDVPAQASSAWFRVAGKIDVNELVPREEREWHDRDLDGNRWLSTVHLCARGYWVWLIPLGSHYTSVGIVAEAADHDYRTFSTEETARAWLRKHEPAVAARLEGVPFADFIAMKDYRHDASQVFSADRWACVGEAGLFVDPLYSPGSDMIALSNSLTTELIADELAGTLDPARVSALDAFFRDWAKLLFRTLALGSCTFGSAEVMSAKLHWDFFYYWAFMCPYFFSRAYELPVAEHERFHRMLHRYAALNERAQRTVQAWLALAPADPTIPFVGLPGPATTLSDLHLALKVDRTPDEAYADMERAAAWAEELVVEILLRGLRRAGPDGAAAFVKATGVDWSLPEARLAADEVTPRDRRKLLGKAARDMERSIGKNTAEGGPTLRELWSRAQGA